MRLTVVVAPCG